MDEVLINTTTAGDRSQPSVCALQGTQFVVVWEDDSDNTIKGQMFGAAGVKSSATAPTQLKLRIFDADTLSGPEIQVSTSPVEPLIRPALAWVDDAVGGGDTTGRAVRGRPLTVPAAGF